MTLHDFMVYGMLVFISACAAHQDVRRQERGHAQRWYWHMRNRDFSSIGTDRRIIERNARREA